MNGNNNLVVTQGKSNNNKVITQDDIRAMKPSELLQFLQEFEGSGRSKRFTDYAASYEKKKRGIAYKYDFSWSWLTKQAFNMGIEYSADGYWCMRSDEIKHVDSTYTIRVHKMDKRQTKKRTIEADSNAWAEWDEVFGDLPCKAVFYTAALVRLAKDMRAGKIVTTLDRE